MDITPYVSLLRTELANAAELGGPEARRLAERLTAPMESAFRLALLDALSTAADEITRDLAPGSVQVRLRRRRWRATTPPSPGSTCACPTTSRAGSSRPPGATGCPSTPGWCVPWRRP